MPLRHLLLAATLAVTPATLLAQDAAPGPVPSEATAATAASGAARPALWVVRDDDTTIYLFGTVHIMKPGVEWFDGGVRDAFERSDRLVVEMIEPPVEQMQALIGRKGLDPANPLSARLTPAQREKLTAALASVGAPANALDPLRPWFAATALALLPLPRLGYDPALGVDNQLQRRAADAGKPVAALETPEEQIGILAGFSEETQLAMFNSALDDFDRIGPMFEAMIGQWAAGDADGLADTINEQIDDTPDVRRALLTDRNIRWADWIRARLAEPGTIFMAVGAGHLAGDDSVQAQLARHDIAAERVGD